MESHKIMVDGEGLRTLAKTCRRNGTQDAWIDVALTWVNAAEPEIARLRADLTAARDAAFAEGIARGKAEAERNEQSAAADAPITEQEVEAMAQRIAQWSDFNRAEAAALLRRLWAERERQSKAADMIAEERDAAMGALKEWKCEAIVRRDNEVELRTERDALLKVVAAADAMRDMYVECAQSIGCDRPRTATAYNAARAALKD